MEVWKLERNKKQKIVNLKFSQTCHNEKNAYKVEFKKKYKEKKISNNLTHLGIIQYCFFCKNSMLIKIITCITHKKE